MRTVVRRTLTLLPPRPAPLVTAIPVVRDAVDSVLVGCVILSAIRPGLPGPGRLPPAPGCAAVMIRAAVKPSPELVASHAHQSLLDLADWVLTSRNHVCNVTTVVI